MPPWLFLMATYYRCWDIDIFGFKSVSAMRECAGMQLIMADLEGDLRRVMAPNTATHLRESKRNVLKDFVHIAGPLGVTHFVILTATQNASYLRIAKSPRVRQSEIHIATLPYLRPYPAVPSSAFYCTSLCTAILPRLCCSCADCLLFAQFKYSMACSGRIFAVAVSTPDQTALFRLDPAGSWCGSGQRQKLWLLSDGPTLFCEGGSPALQGSSAWAVLGLWLWSSGSAKTGRLRSYTLVGNVAASLRRDSVFS